jgi:hypothetical protein
MWALIPVRAALFIGGFVYSFGYFVVCHMHDANLAQETKKISGR